MLCATRDETNERVDEYEKYADTFDLRTDAAPYQQKQDPLLIRRDVDMSSTWHLEEIPE